MRKSFREGTGNFPGHGDVQEQVKPYSVLQQLPRHFASARRLPISVSLPFSLARIAWILRALRNEVSAESLLARATLRQYPE